MKNYTLSIFALGWLICACICTYTLQGQAILPNRSFDSLTGPICNPSDQWKIVGWENSVNVEAYSQEAGPACDADPLLNPHGASYPMDGTGYVALPVYGGGNRGYAIAEVHNLNVGDTYIIRGGAYLAPSARWMTYPAFQVGFSTDGPTTAHLWESANIYPVAGGVNPGTWHYFEFTWVADQSYKSIIIGNFATDDAVVAVEAGTGGTDEVTWVYLDALCIFPKGSECGAVGVDGHAGKGNAMIYPNPLQDGIGRIMGMDGQAGQWSVTNLLGVEVQKGSGDVVDLSSLPSGVYLLHLADNVQRVIR